MDEHSYPLHKTPKQHLSTCVLCSEGHVCQAVICCTRSPPGRWIFNISLHEERNCHPAPFAMLLPPSVPSGLRKWCSEPVTVRRVRGPAQARGLGQEPESQVRPSRSRSRHTDDAESVLAPVTDWNLQISLPCGKQRMQSICSQFCWL